MEGEEKGGRRGKGGEVGREGMEGEEKGGRRGEGGEGRGGEKGEECLW